MKKLLLSLTMLILAIAVNAQTKAQKNNLTAGGGLEQYNGDLGNSFFDFQEEWYGHFRLTYSRYLNRSFDAQVVATIGDIGRCFDGPLNPDEPVLMLRSRLTTAGINLKYKFANGYLLKEDAIIAPYVYAGAAFINQKDVWTHEPRVKEGNYSSLNAGLGISFRLSSKMQFVYNLGLGYLTSDSMDFISKGRNDMYLQDSIAIGYNF